MAEIQIAIKNKIPEVVGDVKCIVSDNSDYLVRFSFDDQWDDGEKTAYFVLDDGYAYPPATITDDVVSVPRQHSGGIGKRIYIGVSQGNTRTSQGIGLCVVSSITDMIDDSAVQPEPTMWEGIVQRIMELEMSKLSPVTADANMTKPVGVTEVGQLMTAPDVFWAQYGVTKYADIKAAVDAGKLCVLRSNNDTAVLASGKFAEFFDFLGDRYLNTRVLYRLRPDDSWTTQNYSIITEHDRTSAITPDSAGRMIPTDKAVYDAILKYAAGGGSGTDLYGSAVVTIAGPDFDNLAVESIVFPPGVTESTAQLDLLKAGAVKMFLMTESESDVACGILDCVSFNTDGDTIAAMFAGTVVGNGGTIFIGLDTDLNDTVTVFPMVANQGGSGGGAPLILIGGNGVPTDGEYPLFVPFTSEVYTFEMLREAAATRPVWLVTLTDAEDWTYAYLTAHPVLPGATVNYITFTGHYWVTPSDGADTVPAEMIPVFGRYGADGVLKILPVEWTGYVKQTELDTALAQKAGIENAVYVLKEGESLDDVPEGYALVYDPYAEEPEKDYYTKPEIDTMFGSYVNDIAELIGGEAIANS